MKTTATFCVGRIVRGDTDNYDNCVDWLYALLEMPGCMSGYVEKFEDGYRPVTVWQIKEGTGVGDTNAERVHAAYNTPLPEFKPTNEKKSFGVHTVQVAKWRKVQEMADVTFIDSTVKSGMRFLAPNWEIVTKVKSGEITEEEYTEVYLRMMEQSIERYPLMWEELLLLGKIAVACYCSAGKFCHRHLLVNVLEGHCKRRGYEFKRLGEIE